MLLSLWHHLALFQVFIFRHLDVLCTTTVVDVAGHRDGKATLSAGPHVELVFASKVSGGFLLTRGGRIIYVGSEDSLISG